MGRRALVSMGVAVLIGGAGVAVGGAARMAGGPDASAIVMAATDVPGAKVIVQKAGKTSAYTDYERQFRFTKPYGASQYRLYDNVAFLLPSADLATRAYPLIEKAYASKNGRAALGKFFFGATRGVTFGKFTPHAVPLGDQGVEASFIARHKLSSANVSLVVFRLDRVIEIGVAAGDGTVQKTADAVALGKVIENRARASLTPAAVTAPAIAGTATQGQTLTASPGTWTNTPTTYGYQWQHCDTGGANCTDIVGATAATYGVVPTDVGTTLRVNVTATNGVGSLAAPSAATAVVT